MNNDVNPFRILLALLIDYFRWTQLAPLVLTWSMLLAMSFVLLFAYNEEAAWSIVDLVMRTILSLPVIGDRVEAWMATQTEDGVFSPDLGVVEWKALALKSWAILSLVFMLAGAVVRRVAGPLPALTLRRKLAIAGVASGVVMMAFAGLVYYDASGWDGQFFSVLLSATGFALVLFVISAWCLSIAHFLGWLSAAVMDPEFNPGAGRKSP